MRWLIDGYNVIRRDPDLRAHEAESLEAGRTALLRLVARIARAGGDRFTVVFDGAPPPPWALTPGAAYEITPRNYLWKTGAWRTVSWRSVISSSSRATRRASGSTSGASSPAKRTWR